MTRVLKFTVDVSDIFRSVGLREWLKFEGDSFVVVVVVCLFSETLLLSHVYS